MDTNEPGTTLKSAHADALRAWLAAVGDSSDDPIVGTTPDDVILLWNRAAEQLYGYPAAEAEGQHISLVSSQFRSAEGQDVLDRVRRGERVARFEAVGQTKDGRRIPVSLTVSPVVDDRGDIIGAWTRARGTLQQQRDELRGRL